jgi:hypothetical protein
MGDLEGIPEEELNDWIVVIDAYFEEAMFNRWNMCPMNQVNQQIE